MRTGLKLTFITGMMLTLVLTVGGEVEKAISATSSTTAPYIAEYEQKRIIEISLGEQGVGFWNVVVTNGNGDVAVGVNMFTVRRRN